MKKFIRVLIVLSMILSTCITADAANMANAADTGNFVNTVNKANAVIKLKINNNIADLKGYSPYKSVSGIMVPLAESSKAVGASVEYIGSTTEAKVKLNSITLVFQAGRKFVLVNGKSLAMGENAVNNKGKIYVPVRFLFEKLGGTVGWDDKANMVVVSIKTQAANTEKTDPVPADEASVSVPVSPDFKPYISEMSLIDSDVLKELQAYKDDKDGELKYIRSDGTGVNYYRTYAESITKLGIVKILERCQTIKSFMELENNVDYTTIDTKFIEQYRYFIMPDSDLNWTVRGQKYVEDAYAKRRYDDVKKYKIIEKAEFYTDTSLNYGSKNGLDLTRGRLKFMFESIDPQYFKDYGLPQYELKKWYNADIEVEVSILFTGGKYTWPHSYYSYCNRFYLTDTRLWSGGTK